MKISKTIISGLLENKSLQTTEINLNSIDESQRSALESIEGLFGLSGAKSKTQTDLTAPTRRGGSNKLRW